MKLKTNWAIYNAQGEVLEFLKDQTKAEAYAIAKQYGAQAVAFSLWGEQQRVIDLLKTTMTPKQ